MTESEFLQLLPSIFVFALTASFVAGFLIGRGLERRKSNARQAMLDRLSALAEEHGHPTINHEDFQQ